MPQAFAALLQQVSTLEELDGSSASVSVLLKAAKLVTISIDGFGLSWTTPGVDATDPIDWDPKQEAARPWLCQDTLKTLAIKIAKAPQQITNAPWWNSARRTMDTFMRPNSDCASALEKSAVSGFCGWHEAKRRTGGRRCASD